MKKLFALLSLMTSASAALATGGHVVTQVDKAFSTPSIEIKAGEEVEFKNDDPYVHNIFTMTDPMFVDLGTFAQGESRSMKFDTPGVFVVECAIHPEMRLDVTVR